MTDTTVKDQWPMFYRGLDLIKKTMVPMAALGLVGWLADTGTDGGFIKDIWTALKTASPPVAMVLFVLFLDERRERREAQRQTNERTIDFINSTNSATNALQGMALSMKELRKGGARR